MARKPRPKPSPVEINYERVMLTARTQLLLNQPFFGLLTMHTTVKVLDDDTLRAAANAKTVFFGQKFIRETPLPQLIGTLAHEIYHIAFQHMARRGDRDPHTWNIACDAVINNDIIEAGMVLPKNVVDMPHYRGWTADDVYRDLLEKGCPEPPRDSTDGWVLANDMDSQRFKSLAEPVDPCAEAIWSKIVEQAVEAAKVAGKALGGGIQKQLDAMLTPKYDWKALLHEYTTPDVRGCASWKRPQRRFIQQRIYLPSAVLDRVGEIVVVIDVSGSIDRRELSRFLSELRSIQDNFRPENIIVMYADTSIQRTDIFTIDEQVNFDDVPGGGGTTFTEAFLETNEKFPDAQVLIYFTDGYGSVDADLPQPSYPVLWMVTTYHRPTTKWGYVAFMEDA